MKTALLFALLSKSKEAVLLSLWGRKHPEFWVLVVCIPGTTHTHTHLRSKLARPLRRVPLTTTYIQKLLDLPDEILGLLQVIGAQQLSLQDGQGHLWAGGEVKACDWRQRDGGAGSVLHTLKLHHFHARDRLEEGENTNTNRLVS